MNRKLCRIFQGVMKIGMYMVPWQMPELLEGAGAVKRLPMMIKSKGYHKIMIVTGPHVSRMPQFEDMTQAMEEAGLDYVIFKNVQANPTDENAEAGVKIFREESCEAFVAFGGGSPMDCCKAIGALYAKPNKTVSQLQGLFRVLKPIPAIFAVPTTAGTGSETTIAAVITDAKTHHKASINDICLMPKAAVLDPELTLGLSQKTTAETGMDALTHAVECYTNNTYNSKLEKKLCEEAVKLIYDNLYNVYQDGGDLKARAKMQKASFYAGRAFTRGGVGYVHALGHTLGGLYGTPHGLAMSVILPHVMRQYKSAVTERLARLAEVCGMAGKNDAEKAEQFLCWIEELKDKMNIPVHLDVIKDEDIPQIIEWALKEANPLYPVPVIWDYKEAEQCLKTLRGDS